MATTHTFGPFRLDADAEILFRGSEPLPVGKRGVALLRALVDRAGAPVSKDTLIDAAWSGLAVEESNLTVQIGALRRALGVEPGGDKWIETLPRRGYRFVGPVATETRAGIAEAPPPVDRTEGPVAPARCTDTERRQITAVSCELIGPGRQRDGMDLEDWREAVAAFRRCVAETIARHDGIIARHLGNTVLILFGYPVAHEHDAERAIRAALELKAAVPMLTPVTNAPMHCRVAVATGIAIVGEIAEGGVGASEIVGDTPDLAMRLQASAQPDMVTIDRATRQLVGNLFDCRDLGAIETDCGREPVRRWHVLSERIVESRFEALRGPTLTPLIGRDEDLELLLRRWAQARAGHGQVVLISGESGIGKSRMAESLLERLKDEPHVHFRSFSSPHHTHSPLYPFIALLERVAGFAPGDSAQAKLGKLEALLKPAGRSAPRELRLIADLLSVPMHGRDAALAVSPQQKREMTFAMLLDQLNELTARNPVVIVFEDAHWIDPTSLELLDRTVAHIADQPVLLVVTFRPEFQPAWVGQPHVSLFPLRRLGRHDSVAILNSVSKGKGLPEPLVEQVLGQTDGVPLFIEELTKTVLESELLRETTDRYELTGRLPARAIPSTLRGSLLARLDRLGSGRKVAQIGATIGRGFSHTLIAAVSALPAQDLTEALAEIVDAELVFRRGTPPHASYQFKHALVQDAAYSSLVRERRQQLHAAIARVLEDQFPDVVAAEPHTLAHHLTEAGHWQAAVGYWLRSGKQALGRPAYVEAANHFAKGIDITALLPASAERDRIEAALQIHAAQVNRIIKGPGAAEAKDAFARAHNLLNNCDSLPDQMIALDGLWAAHIVRGELADARIVADRCMASAARHGGAEAMTWANRLTGATLWETGAFADARRHLESAVALHTAGDRIISSSPAGSDSYVLTLTYLARTFWLLGYPEQALAANHQALARARDLKQPMSIAAALWTNTMLRLWESHPEGAKMGADQLLAHCLEFGIGHYLPFARFAQGSYLARFGDPRLAIEVMQASVDQSNLWSTSPTYPRSLAVAHTRLGEHRAALDLLDEALQRIEKTQRRQPESEIRRIRAEVLFAVQCDEQATIEMELALAVARKQAARWLELLAATSLAHRWCDRGNRPQAHTLLAPVYEWFTEGFDLPALMDAKALLDRTLV
jgi:DNA-binding winged helix-turn-helix (wHTH) protein/tetratricopeptide (TPR) repeat protein